MRVHTTHTYTAGLMYNTPHPPTHMTPIPPHTHMPLLCYLSSVRLHLVQGEELVKTAHTLNHLFGRPSQQEVFLSTNDIHSLPFG